MNFCNKCGKQTPTKKTGTKEECMVCGYIISEYEVPKGVKFINDNTAKEMKKLLQKDENTGQYKNASTVGRNVLIGLMVIAAGVLYSSGGIPAVIDGTVFIILLLVVVSIVYFIAAMSD